MCGITGVFEFNPSGANHQPQVDRAIGCLHPRGPDSKGGFSAPGLWLGHTRLSIIDTSPAAAQPFCDASGRYTLVFNGEIYNFKDLRYRLQQKGIVFSSDSDTEVLLQWLILHGQQGLTSLEGFFAFAFYDQKKHSLLLARDRYGIKPLLWHLQDHTLRFASEMKAMMALGIPRELDMASLELYLQLNYIPAPWSIFQHVNKLLPGHYLMLENGQTRQECYYQIPTTDAETAGKVPSYQEAMKILSNKLEGAVVKRLYSDVPLGTFLSGGIDSSIITALAARNINHLNTFSIGFRDEPMFDETRYARQVAKMHGTNHTEFSLTTSDLLECLDQVMDHIDEPFADSSALAVYILSRETRRSITVALSGDGADEMFAGYNKHMAELKARQGGLDVKMLAAMNPVLRHLPQSRNHPLTNRFRQWHRFGAAVKLHPAERYWQWASVTPARQAHSMLLHPQGTPESIRRKQHLIRHITREGDFNQVLLTDMQLVLPNDMLTKVDLMSMAHSLEVRVPFLDHELVDWVFSLPASYKIDGDGRKKILRDTFRPLLPQECYHRNKQGFEVPLLRWFRRELRSRITDELLADTFIAEQGIFNPRQITLLKQQLFSASPADAPARIWALMVFQHWWKKNMTSEKEL
ncbi:MAG: asparagine synthase (glutamine-hydrolyzing) [Bacteroidales bacterium]